jgi:ubiquinone/menaquinone biosynthesis C-methylase UbiE
MNEIDPEAIIAELGERALIEAAEEYFARIDAPSYHFQKPFTGFSEAPYLLHHLSSALHLINGFPGVRILDFGAGSCWLSRVLAQMGANVIAADVSASALRLGEELLNIQPLIGQAGTLSFTVFDGQSLALEDGAVDRVIVSDAWHHVVSQELVLSEFFRVLSPTGTVVISDCGPVHSKSPQSQFEMRNFLVIERDTDTDVLKRSAERVGFEKVEAFMYAPVPIPIAGDSLEHEYLHGDYGQRLAESADAFHFDHRLIRLAKSSDHSLDSRQPAGLASSISADFDRASRRLDVTVTNVGGAVWLTDPANPVGQVNIGLHLMRDNVTVEFDLGRMTLAGPIRPGESCSSTLTLPPEWHGDVVIDVVAEGVGWFEAFGSTPVIISVTR